MAFKSTALIVLLVATSFIAVTNPVSVRASVRKVTFAPAFDPDTRNGIAVSRSAPVAFVTSRFTDTLFAIDPRTGAEIGRITVGDGPLYVHVFESGSRRTLAVTCDGELGAPRNAVALVDASDPSHMSVSAVAYLPDEYFFLFDYATVRFTSDGTTLVTAATDEVRGSGLLLTFDVATGAERGRVRIGYVPAGADLVEAGGRVLVAVSHATTPRGRLTIVDVTNPASPAVTVTVTLPKRTSIFNVNDVALTRDGRTGFIASADGNALFAFDATTGAILSRTFAGSSPASVRLVEQGGLQRVVVTSEQTSQLLIFDVADPRSPKLAATFDSPSAYLDEPPAVSADGRLAICTSAHGDRVSAVDLTTGSMVATITTGGRPIASALWEGPEGRFALVLGVESRNVKSLRLGPSGFVPTGNYTGPEDAVTFSLYQNVVTSDDGRYAFVASGRTNELFAIDLDTASLVGRVAVGRRPSQVATKRDASGRQRVAVYSADDSMLAMVDATDPAHMSVTGVADIATPNTFLLDLANIAFSGDGSVAFVADANQFVYAIDSATAEVEGIVGAGFIPMTLALREEGGTRTLAVLNAQDGATSVAILDATEPRAMSVRAKYEAPANLSVALNNVPSFTVDGRHAIVGASFSAKVFAVDVATGTLAGIADESNAVRPLPFADGTRQKFASVNLGPNATAFFKLSKKGAPRPAGFFEPLDGTYFVAANQALLGPDGTSTVVPNYGRNSLLAFDSRSGVISGELDLGGGPGEAAIDWTRRRAVVLEVNGTASSVIVGDLADATTPRASPSGARRAVRSSPTLRGARSGERRATTNEQRETRGSAAGGRATYSLESKRILTWQALSSPK